MMFPIGKHHQQIKLTAMIAPADATNQKINWESSNDRVATVDDSGWVRASVPGVCIITVATDDGNHTAICLVISEFRRPPCNYVIFDRPILMIPLGEAVTIKLISCETVIIESVQWFFIPAGEETEDNPNNDQIIISEVEEEDIRTKTIISNPNAKIQKLGPVGIIEAIIEDFDGNKFPVMVPVEIIPVTESDI